MPTYRIPVDITGFSGGPGVNVWHVRAEDIVAGLAQAVDTLFDFYTAIASVYPSGVVISCDPSKIVDVENSTNPSGLTGWSVNASGPSSKAPAPVAVVIGWRTSLSARRGRGRTFISPLTASVTDTDGTPRATELTTIRNAAAALVATSEAATGFAVGVYGQQNPGASEPRVLRDIVGYAVRDTFAVLRSRRD